MRFVYLPKEIFYIQRLAFAGIERANAFIYLETELSQIFDVRQQALRDFLLIARRQVRQFGDGSFKCFDHRWNISRSRLAENGFRRQLRTCTCLHRLTVTCYGCRR